jgi:hypothetical protein
MNVRILRDAPAVTGWAPWLAPLAAFLLASAIPTGALDLAREVWLQR